MAEPTDQPAPPVPSKEIKTGTLKRMLIADLLPNRLPGNPRIIDDEAKGQLRQQLDTLGNLQPITYNLRSDKIISGNQRVEQYAGLGVTETDVWCVDLDEQQERIAVVALNNHAGEFDDKKLLALLDAISESATEVGKDPEDALGATGFTDDILKALLDETPKNSYAKKNAAKNALTARFILPPFTILDSRQPYWLARKRLWHDLGLRAEEGREHLLSTVCRTKGMERGGSASGGGSLFDPVLCEVMYNWFCPRGGYILDPFAGESSKGVVASMLGHPYVGAELRSEQIEANNAQWKKILGDREGCPQPQYVPGDSANLEKLLPNGEWADFVWTSPPYFNLEVYSEDAKDGSTFVNYEKFMEWYRDIFRQVVSMLKPNRFLAVKVGEVRDKTTGAYHNFVGDNVECFRKLGLKYYNEAVLLTPFGSLPIRAGRHFLAGRKLGKSHQNVLVFVKGSIRAACDELGELPAAFALDAVPDSDQGAADDGGENIATGMEAGTEPEAGSV